MEDKNKGFIHNLLIVLGSIFLVECITMLGVVLSAIWYLEYGG